MNNKGVIVSALAIIAVLAFVFLPLATLSLGDSTVMSMKGLNYFTGSVEVSVMGVTQDVELSLEVDVILILAGAALAFIGGLKNSKKLSIIGSVIGALVVILNVANASSEFGNIGMGMTASVGLGMWIALVAFVGCVVMAVTMKKVSEAEPATIVEDFNNQQ